MTTLSSHLWSDPSNKNGLRFLFADERTEVARGISSIVEPATLKFFYLQTPEFNPFLKAVEKIQPHAVFIGYRRLEDAESLNLIIGSLNLKNIYVFILIEKFHYEHLIPALTTRATLIFLNESLETIRSKVSWIMLWPKIVSKNFELIDKNSTLPAGKYESTNIKLLTPSEIKVIKEMMAGNSLTEIARRLNKSIKTISSQKLSAKKRLGLSSDYELYLVMNAHEGEQIIADAE